MDQNLSETAVAVIGTGRSARWSKQLVGHWGRHGRIETQGSVTTMSFEASERWPASVVRVDPRAAELVVTVWAADPGNLRANCESIAEHLRRFAGHREELAIEWSRQELPE